MIMCSGGSAGKLLHSRPSWRVPDDIRSLVKCSEALVWFSEPSLGPDTQGKPNKTRSLHAPAFGASGEGPILHDLPSEVGPQGEGAGTPKKSSEHLMSDLMYVPGRTRRSLGGKLLF